MKIELNELTINELENFYDILLSITSSEKIVLDFENVEKIDLCAYQLLISYKKYCDLNKIELSIINLNSLSIKSSLKIYNLYEILGVEYE